MELGKKWRVKPDGRSRLEDWPTGAPEDFDAAAARGDLERDTRRLAELQYDLYAENRQSVLVVLQAMDAGGKDGTIRHVFAAMNPQGCRVQAFKEPTPEELAHDFLWRIHRVAPRNGEVVVFNRSHYEDVLVARVHRLVPEEVWKGRYDAINAFEALLAANRTRIVKFFLHISPEEQLKRFRARLDNPAKNWKISESDYTERAFWPDYRKAFEAMFERCSAVAPWYVIPSDDKGFRNFAVARILLEEMEEMRIRRPEPGADLERIRQLAAAAR